MYIHTPLNTQLPPHTQRPQGFTVEGLNQLEDALLGLLSLLDAGSSGGGGLALLSSPIPSQPPPSEKEGSRYRWNGCMYAFDY